MIRKKYIGPGLLISIIAISGVVSITLSNILNFFPHDTPPIIYVFQSQWNTTKTSMDSSNDHQVRLPLISDGIYDFMVD